VIANPTAHRRANAFAEALADEERSQEPAEQCGAQAADRHADPGQNRLLSLAHALEDVPRPTLDAETKTVQRAQLIAAMEAALADGTMRVPEQRRGPAPAGTGGAHRADRRRRWSRRIAAGGLSVGVAAGAFGGVAAASTNALPGDSLYGLKRGMEDMRLGLTDSDTDRGKVYLDLASTRLQEARRLMERDRNGRLDPESVGEIRRALSGMQQEAAEGHRLLTAAYKKDGSLKPMAALSSFSTSHRKGWSDLRDRLPSQLTDVGDRVSSVFNAIEHEVAPLQKLLPPSDRPGTTADSRDGAPGSNHSRGVDRTAPSSAAPSDSSSGKGRAVPSGSSSPDSGLLGGADGLLDGSNSPATGSAGPSAPLTPPPVTLPPILPSSLLPGLGLPEEDN
jgi:hypothetical protein